MLLAYDKKFIVVDSIMETKQAFRTMHKSIGPHQVIFEVSGFPTHRHRIIKLNT